MFTAKFKNSCNQPLSGVAVSFPVVSGPNTGSTGSGTTDSTGTATFSYTSSLFGIDTVQPTVTNPAGNITSAALTVNWTTAKLTLRPPTGPNGTKVKFGGSGYGAGETVDVHWGGQSGPIVATPTSSAGGGIGGTFVVPAQQGGGDVQVVAVGATSGKGGAAIFTVTPSSGRRTGEARQREDLCQAESQFRRLMGPRSRGNPNFHPVRGRAGIQPRLNTAPAISCSNSTGVNSNSRPFSEVVPLPDGTCGAVPIASGTEQAGVSDLNAFDMTVSGALNVAVAGNIRFDGYSDDGFFIGIGKDNLGSQATYVSGAMNGSPPATTYEKAYPVVGSDLGVHGPQDAGIVINFPTAGSYPVELDYTECCNGQLQMVLTATGSRWCRAGPG